MVIRKPVAPAATINAASDKPDEPYPEAPTSTEAHNPPIEKPPPHEYEKSTDADTSAYNPWGFEGQNVPLSLAPGRGNRSTEALHNGAEEIPESLRIGRPGYTPRSSADMQRPVPEPTNPYIRRQQTGQSGSSEGWNDSPVASGALVELPPPPSNAPPPPPVLRDHAKSVDVWPVADNQIDTPPADNFAEMSLGEQSANPWQTSLDTKPLPQQPGDFNFQRQESDDEAWTNISATPLGPASTLTQTPVPLTRPSEESPAWDLVESSDRIPPSGLEVVAQEPEPPEHDTWQMTIEEQQGNYLQAQESGVIENSTIQPIDMWTEEQPPALPPRHGPPPRPPRPEVVPEEILSSGTGPTVTTGRQKKETYEIKKVSWYDATASSNPRISPILVQNANGPCPLLALVNALTLSTPAGADTALVETLRSREQVSLGLLLHAVFDELMSGRRGDAAQELPDVVDLYAFLVTLHTGMNVNPRFFPPPPTNLIDDPRRSMSHVHPIEREEAIPGTFEETREMKLYSTFSIPLIHGWLPAKDSPAYAALSRSAKTYEDAQNLMFREEELEDKLSREGLNFEEQATLEDISTIKSFFVESATQLTPFGLQIIGKSIAPGSVAILFRNDHFSTLYRHPESHQLLHLVTDMGYAGHEEVVWESLVDVNGENCEFFSGDFRIVGNAPNEARPSADESEWTTVSDSNQNQNQPAAYNSLAAQTNQSFDPAPMSPNTEQEDHDLALALQLQDEEEQRHQAEVARRRRETELSQQYIEQQGSQVPQIIPNQIPVTQRGARGGSRNQGRPRGPSHGAPEIRPAIPPRRNNTNLPNLIPVTAPLNSVADPEAGVDAPPPSYEQAATLPSYIPPVNHPAHPSAAVDDGGITRARRTSAYAANSAAYGGGAQSAAPPALPRVSRGSRVNSASAAGRAGGGGLIDGAQNPRRHGTSSSAQQHQQDKDKDCVIM